MIGVHFSGKNQPRFGARYP